MRPIGISLYEEAAFQGRLWTPQVIRNQVLLGAEFGKLQNHTLDSSGGISSMRNLIGTNNPAQSIFSQRPTLTTVPGAPDRWAGLFGQSAESKLDFSSITVNQSYAGMVLVRCDAVANGDVVPLCTNGSNGAAVLGMAGSTYTLQWRTAGLNRLSSVAIACGSWGLLSWTSSRFWRSNVGATSFGASYSIGLTRLSGAWTSGATQYLVGAMGMAFLLSSATVPQIQQLEAYAAWSIGRPELLRADHPYRNNPPLRGI